MGTSFVPFFIECFKEGDVLVRIYVDVALRQCLIGGDIVGEGDDGHFEAFFSASLATNSTTCSE